MEKIKRLKELINQSNAIVLFTGAGISVPSGILDFRSENGLYTKRTTKIDPEEIISKTFFNNNPKMFYQYYKKHFLFPNLKPNPAHYFFSNLEKEGKLRAIITQNIDNFHQDSGSTNVLELHGNVHRNYCTNCKKYFSLDYILKSKDIPYCDECSNIIKPDITLYDDILKSDILEQSVRAIENSDLLLIVGTSLVVYPAAGLIRYFRGKNIVLINKQKTPYDDYIDLVINKDIIEVINELNNL